MRSVLEDCKLLRVSKDFANLLVMLVSCKKNKINKYHFFFYLKSIIYHHIVSLSFSLYQR